MNDNIDMSWGWFFLDELFTIERAQNGKSYPAGTILVQVSATNGQVLYLEEDNTVETKFAVLKLIDELDINKKYLYYIIENNIDEFMNRYKADMNIQVDDFKHMKIQVHYKKETQDYFCRILELLDEDIKETEKEMKLWKDHKEYMLDKLLC